MPRPAPRFRPRAASAVSQGWLWAGLILFLLGRPSTHSFVAFFNEQSRPLRWNLTAFPAFVHTNIVNRQTKSVRYFVASDAFSSANRAAEFHAVRACFDQWQSVPGTILKFEQGGLAGPSVDINTADQTNVVFWAKRSTLVNGGRDNISGLRGFTVVSFTLDNTLLEADMVLNGVDFQWLTDLGNSLTPQPFIEATLLHEIGHFIGLDHTPVGGATVNQSHLGLSTELGLSSDEMAAARALYPQAAFAATLGQLNGRVLMNGRGIFGAIVNAEDARGNLIAATASRASGFYELPAMPPGPYQIRATPLDPPQADSQDSLMRGRDIAGDYVTAETEFLPTTNHSVVLLAGRTVALDLPVTAGPPPFRIAAISHPSDHPQADTALRVAGWVRQGQSQVYIGVSSKNLPTQDATLSVTGEGVEVGPTLFKPNRFFGGVHLLSATLRVASNAPPGLRSLVVRQGRHAAYANGYLEILPPFPDFNFDELDDRFQRRFFPLFTAPEASPLADPDGDKFSNRREFLAGSDPTNPLSALFRIEQLFISERGARMIWQSAPGQRFRVLGRPELSTSPWEALGPVITSQSDQTEFLDSAIPGSTRVYQIELLP